METKKSLWNSVKSLFGKSTPAEKEILPLENIQKIETVEELKARLFNERQIAFLEANRISEELRELKFQFDDESKKRMQFLAGCLPAQKPELKNILELKDVFIKSVDALEKRENELKKKEEAIEQKTQFLVNTMLKLEKEHEQLQKEAIKDLIENIKGGDNENKKDFNDLSCIGLEKPFRPIPTCGSQANNFSEMFRKSKIVGFDKPFKTDDAWKKYELENMFKEKNK